MLVASFLAIRLLLPIAATDPQAQPLFAPGERLHYKGYAFNWIPVGDVWFEVNSDMYREREAYRIDARALGRYLVYTLDIRLRSFVDVKSLRSLEFRRREVGTERREYRVIFDRERGKALYRRKPGKFASVKAMDETPWEDRSTFKIDDRVNDILYTLYFARDIGDRVGNEKNYWFVEKTPIWKARVTITGEERLALPGVGAFDALKVAITPDYSGEKETGERFAGLFGVEGTLEVWVDKKTRIPLIVRGQVPFVYIFRPTVSVVLKDYRIPAKLESPHQP